MKGWGGENGSTYGGRVGELCTLKYSDQEQDRLYIQRTETKYKDQNGKTVYAVRDFPKSESSMDGIELSNSAIKIFGDDQAHEFSKWGKSDYLFYDNEHGRLKIYFFNRTLRKICNKIDIPFRSMHKLKKRMLWSNK